MVTSMGDWSWRLMFAMLVLPGLCIGTFGAVVFLGTHVTGMPYQVILLRALPLFLPMIIPLVTVVPYSLMVSQARRRVPPRLRGDAHNRTNP
jgi:hypothetical protein